jgi:hypothetical protein
LATILVSRLFLLSLALSDFFKLTCNLKNLQWTLKTLCTVTLVWLAKEIVQELATDAQPSLDLPMERLEELLAWIEDPVRLWEVVTLSELKGSGKY